MSNTRAAKQFWNTYDSYLNQYDQFILDVFDKWFKQIDPKIEEQFGKNILIETQMENNYCTFTINLNRYYRRFFNIFWICFRVYWTLLILSLLLSHVHEQIEESEYWKLIKLSMPYAHQEFTNHTLVLKYLHRNITMLVKSYNVCILAGIIRYFG